jgi:hypothetical protein
MMQGLITSIDGHCCPDLISPALICQLRASRHPAGLGKSSGATRDDANGRRGHVLVQMR